MTNMDSTCESVCFTFLFHLYFPTLLSDPHIFLSSNFSFNLCKYLVWPKCVCVCIPVLVTTFPEWLSGTEPLPHTPYHNFPAQSSLGADILVYWIGKIIQTCAPSGS